MALRNARKLLQKGGRALQLLQVKPILQADVRLC
jgi:hypothetical protein